MQTSQSTGTLQFKGTASLTLFTNNAVPPATLEARFAFYANMDAMARTAVGELLDQDKPFERIYQAQLALFKSYGMEDVGNPDSLPIEARAKGHKLEAEADARFDELLAEELARLGVHGLAALLLSDKECYSALVAIGEDGRAA